MSIRVPRVTLMSRFVGFIALLVAAASFSGSAQQPRQTYDVITNWAKWPAADKFNVIAGAAVDAKGIVYVYRRDTAEKAGAGGTGSIRMFDPEGKYLGVWAGSDKPGFAVTPHSLAIDRQGFFWTVDRDGEQVKKYRPDGSLVMTVGTLRGFGMTPTTFNGPTGLHVFDDGGFVVSDGYFNSRLVWFDKAGNFVKQIGGAYRAEPFQLQLVHGVAVDSRGRILTADVCQGALHGDAVVPGQVDPVRIKIQPTCKPEQDSIVVFDKEGQLLARWKTVPTNLSLAVSGDRVFVSDLRGNLMILNGQTGAVLETYAGFGPIHQITVGPNGDVYLSMLRAADHGPNVGIMVLRPKATSRR